MVDDCLYAALIVETKHSSGGTKRGPKETQVRNPSSGYLPWFTFTQALALRKFCTHTYLALLSATLRVLFLWVGITSLALSSALL